MKTIRKSEKIPGLSIIGTALKDSDYLVKFVAQYERTTVKVEISPVLRGLVFEPGSLDICSRIEEMFGFASMNIVSFEDLFAGKICAALDRHHPRDLFDIKGLIEQEGITKDLIKVFIVYLISCNRPISELLAPNPIDLEQSYSTEFSGMTFIDVELKDLIKTRDMLISSVNSMMEDKYKKFLISFKQGEPEWDILGLNNIHELPAVLWKLHNLKQMNSSRRKKAVEKLEKVLYV